MSHLLHRRHHLAWALVLVVVLVLGSIYHYSVTARLEKRIAALENATPPVSTPSPEKTPTTQPEAPVASADDNYTNTNFGYSLTYPASLQLKVYNPENASIGLISGSGDTETVDGKVALRAISAANAAEKKMGMDDFIFQKVKLLCDADGGGVSVSCPKKLSSKPLALTSGLSAYTLTLQKEEKAIGPEAFNTKSEAVFFVVDLSTANQRAILVIHPIGDGTVEQSRAVALTVKR